MRVIRLTVLLAATFTRLVMGVTFTVTTNTDTNSAGDLRNAINNSQTGDTILFNCGVPCTIKLSGPLPVITHALTIDGGTLGNVAIDGANLYRVFFVDTGNVALRNLTIQNATAQGGNGGAPGGAGGGLGAGAGLFVNQTSAVVTVTNCSFVNNTASGGTGNSGAAGSGGGGLTFNGGAWGSNFGAAGGGGGFLAAGNAGAAGNSGAGGSGANGGGGGGGGAYVSGTGGAAGAAFGSNAPGAAGAAGTGLNGGAGGNGGFGGGGGGGGDSNALNGHGGKGGDGGFGGGGGGGGVANLSLGQIGGDGGAGGPGGGGGAGGNGFNGQNGNGGMGGLLAATVRGGNGGDGGAGGGGGGAAAGPAIFVRSGVLITNTSSASGAIALGGTVGFGHGTPGTADSTPAFNYAGTVNGSTATGPLPNALTNLSGTPTLSITKTHAGNFTQGQNGAPYTITVTNAAGAPSTSGLVTVSETLPGGLAFVSMAGTGWTCPPGSTSCTRSDALAGGASYPTITVTVNVAANASSPQVNTVGVSGGGSVAATANDSTAIIGKPLLSVSKTHTGNFTQGQVGATYTVTVSNAALSNATSGTVTVTETIPAGLTLASMAGTGWTCSGALCTRSDALAGGSSYPPITVTVNVASTAPVSVTNTVSVVGGGDPIIGHNATDLTAIASAGPGGTSNVALFKPASQSSTILGAVASRAVDGSTDGAWVDASVIHTNLDANAWWQVDLGASATVSSIVVWNRTDCCGSRMSDFWVFLSDTPFGPTDTPATLQVRAGTFSSHQTTAPNPATTIAAGGAHGRYVRVQLSGTNYLNLAELQVFGTSGVPIPSINVALGKAASQSSTILGAAASRAVDGNTDGTWANGSVVHTNLDTNAWWQVDLGATATVDSIVVWNRTDCCGDRMSDFWVFLSNTPFGPTDTPATLQARAGTFSSHQTVAPGPSLTISTGAAQGRYVRVQLSGTNYLNLAEAQVFGTIANPPVNQALGKAASQSSTIFGAAASRAVDGNTDGAWVDGSVSHTNADPNAWWQVDLGASSTIGTVVVWNRTDCCMQRMTDFWVFVSATPFASTDTPATLQARPGTFSTHLTSFPNPSASIPVNTTGRYVRIQLSGADYLHLAEVQVF